MARASVQGATRLGSGFRARATFAPGEIEQATQDIAEITNYAAAATLAQQEAGYTAVSTKLRLAAFSSLSRSGRLKDFTLLIAIPELAPS